MKHPILCEQMDCILRTEFKPRHKPNLRVGSSIWLQSTSCNRTPRLHCSVGECQDETLNGRCVRGRECAVPIRISTSERLRLVCFFGIRRAGET